MEARYLHPVAGEEGKHVRESTYVFKNWAKE